MTSLSHVAKFSFAALALAPLTPVVGLMWVAKGLQALNQKNCAQKPISKMSWEMDTIVYCPSSQAV